jgi:hypothetical protein
VPKIAIQLGLGSGFGGHFWVLAAVPIGRIMTKGPIGNALELTTGPHRQPTQSLPSFAMPPNALPLLASLALIPLFHPPAYAKRLPPPSPAPITLNGIQYSAPNRNGTYGTVRAVNFKTGKMLWDQTIYKIAVDPKLESDVQWVYIRKLQRQGQLILVTNERNQRYQLNPKTRQVKMLR